MNFLKKYQVKLTYRHRVISVSLRQILCILGYSLVILKIESDQVPHEDS